MYRKVEDFIQEWKYESESTVKVFENINNDALNKKDYKNVRSIAVLAWHITITLREMITKTGVKIEGPDEDKKAPMTISEIISEYKRSAMSVLEQVSKWSDTSLEEKTMMYGEEWKKGTTLSVLIRHQTHHRGQLTVLMRQAGLRVPGVYGPAKEEWAQMGMMPQE